MRPPGKYTLSMRTTAPVYGASPIMPLPSSRRCQARLRRTGSARRDLSRREILSAGSPCVTQAPSALRVFVRHVPERFSYLM